MIEEKFGIEYHKPEVFLLRDGGFGVAEIAARTCYDSFNNSENEAVKDFNYLMHMKDVAPDVLNGVIEEVEGIENSALLEKLAWVHHHHSIIEHASLSYLIKGTSRGVLQEHARHRIQSISVRSTRYTMSNVINAFVASLLEEENGREWFIDKVVEFDMLVTASKQYNRLEWGVAYDKLMYQLNELKEEDFLKLAVAKSSYDYVKEAENSEELFKKLQSGKSKRNVGDAFKHIVTDNWKVDLVVTFNIRSLKNYFDLRDSGAAYFQIQWLAKAMKEVTPVKYLKLIDKAYRGE